MKAPPVPPGRAVALGLLLFALVWLGLLAATALSPPADDIEQLTWVKRPRVLIDGRHDRSPWVAPGLVQRCGAGQLGAAGTLGNARSLGPTFPGMVWRVILPILAAGACPA